MHLVPKDFLPPEEWASSEFFIRKLCAVDVYWDYVHVMDNQEIIRKTRGGNWPSS